MLRSVSVAPRVAALSAHNARHASNTSGVAKQIAAANAAAITKLHSADLWLKDIRPAREVIPALNNGRKLVLLSGPPVTWPVMGNAQKGAVKGIVMFEGWAKTPEQAEELCASGEVSFEPNHHHESVGPMAGTISPSFPVYVVENRAFGNVAFSRPADLAQQFGDFKNIQDIIWWRDGVAPSLSKGLKKLGGLHVSPLLRTAFEMGDEAHNHNNALTSLFSNELAVGMVDADIPKDKLIPILKWYASSNWLKGSGVRACLGLVMACAKASLDPIANTPGSSIVSVMARNGYEFGVRCAGTGDKWYVAPSPYPEGKFFPPYVQSDVGRDMGDSAICETNGWGAFIIAGAPTFAKGIPADVARLQKITADNAKVMASPSNPLYPIPALDFKGAPAGIDVRKVLKTGIEPWIDTGITHKDAGHRVIGRGFVRAPMKCFEQAADSLAASLGVTRAQLVATLDQ